MKHLWLLLKSNMLVWNCYCNIATRIVDTHGLAVTDQGCCLVWLQWCLKQFTLQNQWWWPGVDITKSIDFKPCLVGSWATHLKHINQIGKTLQRANKEPAMQFWFSYSLDITSPGCHLFTTDPPPRPQQKFCHSTLFRFRSTSKGVIEDHIHDYTQVFLMECSNHLPKLLTVGWKCWWFQYWYYCCL